MRVSKTSPDHRSEIVGKAKAIYTPLEQFPFHNEKFYKQIRKLTTCLIGETGAVLGDLIKMLFPANDEASCAQLKQKDYSNLVQKKGRELLFRESHYISKQNFML